MKRREFLKKSLLAGAALSFSGPLLSELLASPDVVRITLLQTNDTHSRLDPFPMDGGRNQGLGGIARRATLVKQIRRQNPATLLVDAGDVFQGTPYFNLYRGVLEYKAMNRCGYDVGTIGNHEFDNGVIPLYQAMQKARFDFVNCNYDLSATPLAERVKPFVIKEMEGIRIGIIGVGVDLNDLVAPDNREGVIYHDPRPILQELIPTLRQDLQCRLIIVLSHLGYKSYQGYLGDVDLAKEVDGIDFIVGGHSHTFMKKPDVVISKGGTRTYIFQVGFGGIYLGKTDFYFRGHKLMAVRSQPLLIDHRIESTVNSTEDIVVG